MHGCMPPSRDFFEGLYRAYNHRRFVHPDPLELVLGYQTTHDIEIAGLIASCLAYGRVAQIINNARKVLAAMGASPRQFIEDSSENSIRNCFKSFRHRFTSGEEMAGFVLGIKKAIKRQGSLETCIASNISSSDETVLNALELFVSELSDGHGLSSLLPRPSMGSACKRLNLYMKWMARRDDVDPGCWESIPPRLLIMPLDTHIYRVCSELGITSRKSADMKTALEITAFFREMNPEDPVKYDFALTRPGIWNKSIPDECLTILNKEAIYG